jgi:hypothetical protein
VTPERLQEDLMPWRLERRRCFKPDFDWPPSREASKHGAIVLLYILLLLAAGLVLPMLIRLAAS